MACCGMSTTRTNLNTFVRIFEFNYARFNSMSVLCE